MTGGPPFYPEESLEEHGLTPDDWDSAGCYALALETPKFLTFTMRWGENYDVDPPSELATAIRESKDLRYVGATGNLRDRFHDHVAGDVRRVKLLAVCPPVGVVDVWTYADFDDAEEHERRHAYELRDANPGTAVYTDGEIV